MSEPRPLLLVVGRHDDGGVGAAALETAATLAAARLIIATVCGRPGPLLDSAHQLGLPTVSLSGSRSDRRRQLVDCAGRAHLVHALGFDSMRLLRSTGTMLEVPLVVTVDRRRLRRSTSLWRSRVRVGAPIRWLVHGSTATGQFVQCRAVRGDEVVTLPLLAFAPAATANWPAARAAARRAMSLAPGVRTIVGFGPVDSAGFRHLDATMASPRPHAFVGLWIDTDPGTTPQRQANRMAVVGPEDGRRLLACADVLVADGTMLAARHAAVDAVTMGIPLVTTHTDLAAGIVSHGVNGYMCARAELPEATAAAIEMSVARTLRRTSVDRRRGAASADSVDATARCYESILDRPLVRPILIGRRATG